jgi:hypothetical protein
MDGSGWTELDLVIGACARILYQRSRTCTAWQAFLFINVCIETAKLV